MIIYKTKILVVVDIMNYLLVVCTSFLFTKTNCITTQDVKNILRTCQKKMWQNMERHKSTFLKVFKNQNIKIKTTMRTF